MSAALLRQAADRLDALADDAQTCVGDDPWTAKDLGWNDVQGMTYTVSTSARHRVAEVGEEESAAYIAAMSPTVGKALATWLRAASIAGTESGHAVAVACAVLGET